MSSSWRDVETMPRQTKGKPPKREPTTYEVSATLTGESTLLAAPKHIYVIDFDHPMLSAQRWLEGALARLKADKENCPKSLLAIARRLESEMRIAFERRQCDAAWTAGAIRNAFSTWGWWPRTRLPKS